MKDSKRCAPVKGGRFEKARLSQCCQSDLLHHLLYRIAYLGIRPRLRIALQQERQHGIRHGDTSKKRCSKFRLLLR